MAEAAAKPPPVGRRGAMLLLLLAAGAFAAWRLDLSPGDLVPRSGGLRIAREFFSAALRPAVDYEAAWVPEGAPAFPGLVLRALARTLAFAAAGTSLALCLALPLAYLSSTSRWRAPGGRLARRERGALAVLRGPLLQAPARLAIAALRSVHELAWAVVLLAALGSSSGSAVVAIALPYSGTLAKVFSEMLDEAPAASASALSDLGAPAPLALLVGRLPLALPDMASYAFYRFECAVRSAAVLGFFGFPTLGYYLMASFENLHYRETWSWLWAMAVLVVVLELWSSALRRRFVA